MADGVITIKYQIREEFCGHCEQEIKEAPLSGEREFNFSSEDVFDWTKWRGFFEFEDGQDEFKEAVEEFIHETISFYATGSNMSVILGEGESDKMIQLILDKFKK